MRYYEDVMLGMNCVRCHVNVSLDPDALCDICRAEVYDKKKCGRCNKKLPANATGWYVPSFGSYSDKSYVCPTCIEFYHQEYIRKNTRLLEISAEKIEIDKEYYTLPKNDSPVDEDDGEYYVTGDLGLSLKEFQDEVRKYKKNKSEILRVRKIIDNYWKRVRELNDEKQDCMRGSGYDVEANR
jgi:hypothetical protein